MTLYLLQESAKLIRGGKDMRSLKKDSAGILTGNFSAGKNI